MFLTILLSSFLTLVELNCENLFDTRHDVGKEDSEFLPEGSRHWTSTKYWGKVNRIGQEILSCSDELPDLVALIEVENDSVLKDLTCRSLLRNAGYHYLMTESPDLRGVDVALLYQPASFRPLCYDYIEVPPLPNMRPTRDILYVKGCCPEDDTLHVFVVHMPSRFGGERYSRPFRQAAANRLCQQLDSLQSVTSSPKILIAGDFNDDADSEVLQQIYERDILNLTKEASAPEDVHGTYRYQGEWECIDHILASPNVYNKVESATIHAPQFLLEEEKRYGGKKPFRTYNGMRYQPGYSDHLPLVVRIAL